MKFFFVKFKYVRNWAFVFGNIARGRKTHMWINRRTRVKMVAFADTSSGSPTKQKLN